MTSRGVDRDPTAREPPMLCCHGLVEGLGRVTGSCASGGIYDARERRWRACTSPFPRCRAPQGSAETPAACSRLLTLVSALI